MELGVALRRRSGGGRGGQSSGHARRAAVAWTLGDYARAERYIDETLVIERMTGRDLTLPMVNLALIRIKLREEQRPVGIFLVPIWIPAAGLVTCILFLLSGFAA